MEDEGGEWEIEGEVEDEGGEGKGGGGGEGWGGGGSVGKGGGEEEEVRRHVGEERGSGGTFE